MDGTMGSYLSAKNINDKGKALNQVIPDHLADLELLSQQGDHRADTAWMQLGEHIGKAVACACVLLDPQEVVIEGYGVCVPAFRSNFEETVKLETYYRGKLPFSIRYDYKDRPRFVNGGKHNERSIAEHI
jgi:predicted NBD/HSP70 family sugar kinase